MLRQTPALVGAAALATAAAAGEIGDNDFRISDIGPDGQPGWVVNMSAVACNETDNLYLVVWRAEGEPPAVNQEFEIYGQLIDGATGQEVGVNDFRISHQGPDGSTLYSVSSPQVAWNSVENQFLAVWRGTFQALASAEYEIFGQRIDGATGALVGDAIRISQMGPDGQWQYFPDCPDVAYNGTDNQYLVVWDSDDDTPPLVDNEFEVFGQRLDGATGAEIGGNFRISDMGPNGGVGFGASCARVAYDPGNNNYLVVWNGNDDTPPLVSAEIEVFGQLIDGATGAEIGGDFWISHQGPDGDPNYQAFAADVAGGGPGVFFAVWRGTTLWIDVEAIEWEVYGVLLDTGAGLSGGGAVQLSQTGPPGNPAFEVEQPEVAYNSAYNEFMVVWRGVVEAEPFDDREIIGQRVAGGTGDQVGPDDFRISDMGPDGQGQFFTYDPAVAYDADSNQYLVTWHGDDNTPPQVDNENEIWGQRLGCPWDCSGALDAVTGINDFLTLLAQWGQVGASCDFNLGAPGVGIDEFLALLSAWGTCQ